MAGIRGTSGSESIAFSADVTHPPGCTCTWYIEVDPFKWRRGGCHGRYPAGITVVSKNNAYWHRSLLRRAWARLAFWLRPYELTWPVISQ
jgi:hypothetical protein